MMVKWGFVGVGDEAFVMCGLHRESFEENGRASLDNPPFAVQRMGHPVYEPPQFVGYLVFCAVALG
jgi:hypothetical protein